MRHVTLKIMCNKLRYDPETWNLSNHVLGDSTDLDGQHKFYSRQLSTLKKKKTKKDLTVECTL